ncbi:MAG: hypothetical protein K8U03_15935 [Planctomycetia bacterium]|nr:hypothetical protein [Planctomycetia bacterium]
MSSITFHGDATVAPIPATVKRPAATLKTASWRDGPEMHEDDALALRIVSAIIFAAVALGTLAMLGTVLICG